MGSFFKKARLEKFRKIHLKKYLMFWKVCFENSSIESSSQNVFHIFQKFYFKIIVPEILFWRSCTYNFIKLVPKILWNRYSWSPFMNGRMVVLKHKGADRNYRTAGRKNVFHPYLENKPVYLLMPFFKFFLLHLHDY